jgi:hypothetical protein
MQVDRFTIATAASTVIIAAMAVVQAIIFWRQWKAMRGQLAAMQSQLSVIQDSLTLTKDSLEFAKKNLEVFVNEKRARIFVELEWLDLNLQAYGTPPVVKYKATCHGQTFAFIDDNRIQVKCTDSKEPPDLEGLARQVNIPKTVPPEMPPRAGTLGISANIDKFIIDSINHGESFVHCRGLIKYKDFVGEERETCPPQKPATASGCALFQPVFVM